MNRIFVVVIMFLISFSAYTESKTLLITYENHTYVRQEPSTNSGIIYELNLGDVVEQASYKVKEDTIKGKTNFWYNIKIGNFLGFVWGEQIAEIIDQFTINNKKYYLFSNRSFWGKYDVKLYSIDNLWTISEGLKKRIITNFTSPKIKEISYAYVLYSVKNDPILVSGYSWGDAGDYIHNEELYFFHLATMNIEKFAERFITK